MRFKYLPITKKTKQTKRDPNLKSEKKKKKNIKFTNYSATEKKKGFFSSYQNITKTKRKYMTHNKLKTSLSILFLNF